MDNNDMMNQGTNETYEGGGQPYGQNTYQSYGQNYNQPYNGQPYGQQGYDQSYQQPYGQNYNQPYGQESIYAQPGEGNGDTKAAFSLILGIVAILICCCFGGPSIIAGIVAIVLAISAKKDNMGQMPGLATGGMVCGIIGILLGCISMVIWVVAMMGDSVYYL